MSAIRTVNKRRNRTPSYIRELNEQLLALQNYLYNLWLRKIKKLALEQNLPVEFFRKKYEQEVQAQIHRYVEEIYFSVIEGLQKKLLTKQRLEKEQRRLQHDLAVSNFFTSVPDINSINEITNISTENYFLALARLIGRASHSKQITAVETIHQLMLFADMAAFQRVASNAVYTTFNTALQSKLSQIDSTSKLIYVTAEDEKVCPICLPFDGRIYQTVQDPGIPDLPQHPNCRCFLEVVI